jgi:RNA polymerase sigma-70 factor (ECF subfamily)
MLFQRILQNTMRDYWRRQKVRNLWTTLLSSFGGNEEDGDERDPLETLQSDDHQYQPQAQLESRQTITIIEQAIKTLPTRQREAFMMRYWEELDVAETAKAMGCSQGSVKTHCSRAVHALAKIMESQGFSKQELGKFGGER